MFKNRNKLNHYYNNIAYYYNIAVNHNFRLNVL